jgi:hypothetical protein
MYTHTYIYIYIYIIYIYIIYIYTYIVSMCGTGRSRTAHTRATPSTQQPVGSLNNPQSNKGLSRAERCNSGMCTWCTDTPISNQRCVLGHSGWKAFQNSQVRESQNGLPIKPEKLRETETTCTTGWCNRELAVRVSDAAACERRYGDWRADLHTASEQRGRGGHCPHVTNNPWPALTVGQRCRHQITSKRLRSFGGRAYLGWLLLRVLREAASFFGQEGIHISGERRRISMKPA